MTENEVRERAELLWGKEAVLWVTPIAASALPGHSVWFIDDIEKNIVHAFDCNGHPTCHDECKWVEAEML